MGTETANNEKSARMPKTWTRRPYPEDMKYNHRDLRNVLEKSQCP